MTVASVATQQTTTGNGVTTAFAWPFQFFAAADLTVALYDTVNQVSVVTTLNGGGSYGYTVTGTQDSVTGEYLSGTVTFNAAPPASYTVTIGRAVPQTQPLYLAPNGPVPLTSIMAALDRTAMQVQDISAGIAAAAAASSGSGSGAAAGTFATVAAAGSTQGAAAALTAQDNTITTGAGLSVVVPAVADTRVIVRNRSGGAINVFPGSGARFETLGTNVAVSLPNNSTYSISMVSATQGYID